MSAFLAEHSYDIPIEDEPADSYLDVLDPRSAWVGVVPRSLFANSGSSRQVPTYRNGEGR